VNTRITFASGVREAMARHLISVFPNEGCGILYCGSAADPLQIMEAIPVRNVAKDADRNYELDPLEYLSLEKKVAGGLRIAGFYHGHPNSAAKPSHRDLEAAMGLFEVTREVYVYAIQRVTAGQAQEMTAWCLNERRNGFTELEIV
jgi:proteasome lid subunit RPN8/RPN11